MQPGQPSHLRRCMGPLSYRHKWHWPMARRTLTSDDAPYFANESPSMKPTPTASVPRPVRHAAAPLPTVRAGS